MRKWIVGLLVAMMVFGSVAPALASAKKSKRVFVQHPYTARQKYKVGADIKTWSYVAPKTSDFTSKTVEILVYARTARGSWEITKTVEGSLYNRARYRHRTFFRATFSLDKTGRYRMRAKYSWKAVDGTMKSKLSSYKYFRVVK
ncbi:MAG: hypothetical protein Q7W16_03445 [Coriobacteriia bacterium]|nr:hypothetical protein [Coriobacteriia bacterium]